MKSFNQKEGNGNIDMGLRIQYRSVINIRNVSSSKLFGRKVGIIPGLQGHLVWWEERAVVTLAQPRRS